MDRLRKEIEPGENDDNLRRFIGDLGSGAIRTWRTRSELVLYSSSPPNSLSRDQPPGTASPSLTRGETESSARKANPQDKKYPAADNIPISGHRSVANPAIAASVAALKVSSSTPSHTMSSQRSRLGRSNARGGSQDINAQAIWNDFFRDHLTPVKELETRAKQIGERIIELEAKMQRNKVAGFGELVGAVGSFVMLTYCQMTR